MPPDAPPKLLSPNRSQGLLLMPTLFDALVEPGHPVRMVWEFTGRLDLSAFLGDVRSREGEAGRPAIDPRLLLAIWLYATLDGVDSGRKVARLCAECVPYRWLCGGVGVEYHTLNDFRSTNTESLRKVLTTSLTALAAEGLVQLDAVALDGIRVRASAGSSSFRRGSRLRELSDAVGRRVESLMAQWEAEGTDPTAPKPSRTKRAFEEKKARLDRAAAVAEKLDKERATRLERDTKLNQKKRAHLEKTLARGSRASATDPDAAVLHMADKGYRPAFNVFVSAEKGGGLVTDVHVTADAADNGQVADAVQRLTERFPETPPRTMLVDGGFRDQDALVAADAAGVEVYTPLLTPRPTKRTTARAEAVERLHARMTTPDGEALYGMRGQLIEFAFANFRNHGLQQFRVRGRARCEAVVLLHALTHNMVRVRTLSARTAVAA